MKYKARYAAVGAYTFNDLAIADGINEKGLAVGAFYLPTFAKYAEITEQNRKTNRLWGGEDFNKFSWRRVTRSRPKAPWRENPCG